MSTKRDRTWAWSVAYKRPRYGKLIWIATDSQSETVASRQARTLMAERHPGKRYIEYGLSKTYYEVLPDGRIQEITREEFES